MARLLGPGSVRGDGRLASGAWCCVSGSKGLLHSILRTHMHGHAAAAFPDRARCALHCSFGIASRYRSRRVCPSITVRPPSAPQVSAAVKLGQMVDVMVLSSDNGKVRHTRSTSLTQRTDQTEPHQRVCRARVA